VRPALSLTAGAGFTGPHEVLTRGAQQLKEWVTKNSIKTLKVAGPRASEDRQSASTSGFLLVRLANRRHDGE